MSRVLIAAGGTGGHLYPALATAGVLRERGHLVSFVGGDRLEARLVPRAGFELHVLPARGFPTAPSLRSALAAGAMLRGLAGARRLLRRVQPDAVLGMGGYPSFAPSWTAGGAGIAVALHEQNATLTRSHRWAIRRADVLALSLPISEGVPPAVRVELVGNPLRASLAAVSRDSVRRDRCRAAGLARWDLEAGHTTVLAFGGSQGAAALNDALLAISWPSGVQVLHVAGRDHESSVKAGWSRAGVRASVVGYVEEMEEAYSVADLVVSRAGATTVAELATFGLPGVLVPLPRAARGAQDANARVLERHGAARVVRQGPDLAARLEAEIGALCGDADRRRAMGEASAALGRPDAAERLADVVESVVPRTP